MRKSSALFFSALVGLFIVSPKPIRSVQARPAANSIAQYDLSVQIQPAEHRLVVAGTWRLPPVSEDTNQIEFYLSPKMHDLNVEIIEPALCSASVSLTSEDSGGDTKWTLKTVQSILSGQSVRLRFSYVSETTPAPQFSITPEGSFAGGGGELWYPQTAYKNRETGVLRFSVPAGEKVISNGALEDAKEQHARGEYAFRVSQPSKFAFASGKYTITRREGKVPFSLYLLHPNPRAQMILEGSARALDFLTHLYGRFPYGQFSLVEVKFPTIVRGTSEFGFVFPDESKLADFDLAYWAHELGHQWWGNVIRSAAGTTGQMMLSEGITQFGALQAVEAVEGSAAAEQFRRTGYRGKGQSAQSYFHLIRSGTDLPLTGRIPKNPDETLAMHRLANSKGFIVLDMLSREIGRERFAAILRRFIRDKANQTTSWAEFQQAIEKNAARNIHWFFDQWFQRTGAPDYQVSWKQEGRMLRAVITQPPPSYRARLTVEIKGANRNLSRIVDVFGEQTSFNFSAPFKIETVVIDPHYKILRWTSEFRKEAALTKNEKVK